MSNTPDALPTRTAQAGPSYEPISLRGLFGKFLALVGLIYGVGFIVILTHTATLNAPVIELFQSQTIIAGIPIWLLICVGVWLWPEFTHRIMADRNTLSDSVKKGLITTGISVGFLIPCVLWIGSKTSARNLPLGVILFALSGLTFALSIAFVVQARSMRWNDPGVRPLLNLICFWFGFVFFVMGYALLLYPQIPQSWGGGHPVKVRLLLKDVEVRNLLAGQDGANASFDSGPVSLYYRNSAYLLVGTPAQPHLIQVPVDQVRGIVWLESQAP
jgi:hypothetical protein